MSRCFPFPPPGYEKKSRAEDADLLKKDKSREKKHKKEKKEKDKREGKEKRDKDKSDEKRREKKDKRKDKERDKKKDRDNEKEKARPLEESRPSGKIASQNGEEVARVKHNSVHEEKHSGQFESYVGNKHEEKHSGQFDSYVGNKIEEKHSGQHDSYLGNKISQNIFLSMETKRSKLVLEARKRIEDSGAAQLKDKHSGQLDSYVGNTISQNTFLSKETKNSKWVPEVGKRIEDGATAKVEKFAVAQPKRDDGMATQVARSSETWFEGKEQNKNKKIDERKYNGQGIGHEERFSGNSAVPSSTATATVESGVAGMFKQSEKSDERRKETNDKIRSKESKSKHKDKDKEKKGRSKDKESDKEKKKEKKAKKEKEKKEKEKEKEKVEEKNAMVDKTKEINKDNLLARHSTNTNTSQLPDSNIGTAVEENLIKKRKDFEPNGVLHAIDNRSSKLLKPTSHPNGRVLEPCLTSTLPPPSERVAVANNLILVSKEPKINGITEAHHPPASLKHKSGGQDDHPQPTVIHKKSPHPDSKYLSQVYSVPKMEELSDSDNQDWLFSSNTSQVMKPKLEASEAEEMPQVWAEAMQIESDDVYALPYVIPY